MKKSQKLSLADLKTKSKNVTSTQAMNKITGGNKGTCHCVHPWDQLDKLF